MRQLISLSSALPILVLLSFGQSTDPEKKETALAPADLKNAMPVLEVFHPTTAALEGVPDSRIIGSAEGAERQKLTPEEAQKNRLVITQAAGKFYWTSRENRRLEAQHSGAFTYFYPPDAPGSYIKMTRVGSKILYLEHVSLWLSTITYWGELEVITEK